VRAGRAAEPQVNGLLDAIDPERRSGLKWDTLQVSTTPV
jgi:hypothetical protein